MDIVEDHEQATAIGHPCERVTHVLKQPEAIRRRGHRTREHRIRIHIQKAQNLTPRPKGGRAFDLRAATPRNRPVGRQDDLRQLLGQHGLADPGLARAKNDASPTRTGGVEPPPQRVQLPSPPNDPLVPHPGKHHSPDQIPEGTHPVATGATYEGAVFSMTTDGGWPE